MATVIRMPEVLANTSEAAIQTWLVAIGDTISVGSPLAEVETEKAVVEYAAEAEGTILRFLVNEGEAIAVGEPIAIIGAPGEVVVDDAAEVAAEPTMTTATATLVRPAIDDDPESETTSPPLRKPVTLIQVPAPHPSSYHDRRFISPLVRRLARERNLDLSQVSGSGPGGRIIRQDIEGLKAGAPDPAHVEAKLAQVASPAVAAAAETATNWTETPHSSMRRAIARRLTESKSTVPHFYLVAECRVDDLVALRRSVNETSPVKVSINDFVLKAAAMAFQDVPEANATWSETAVRRYSSVDMSVAVSIEGGLVTPVLRSVEKMSLTEVNRTVTDLAARSRAGKLKQHELEGGSFAVSNLGMYGVTEFSAIINPPQSAILAVGLARQQAIVVEGNIMVGTIMTVTLSADHRVLDGALAARWLSAFTKRIENPLMIIV